MTDIAIVSTNKFKYSETFISNHVKLLPAKVHYLFDGYLPQQHGSDRFFVEEKDREQKDKLKAAIGDYLSENKIKAVMAEYGPSGVEMMDICFSNRIPIIVHFHGYDAYRNDMIAAYGNDYPELFEKAAAIISVSNHMTQRLIQLGAPENKIHCIPCGYDEKMFQCHDAGKNPPVFLAVCRFAETKSPHLTILAFAEVVKKIPEAKLKMAGDGHLLEACQILVKALGIADAVEFLGVKPHEEVSKLMRESLAYVQHSVTAPSNDTEGTPVSVMEASASGLPVISTFNAGIPDVVEHEATGFLVKEGDYKKMADYMIRVAKDSALATRLGKAGSEKALKEFTLNISIAKLWSVIQSTF